MWQFPNIFKEELKLLPFRLKLKRFFSMVLQKQIHTVYVSIHLNFIF